MSFEAFVIEHRELIENVTDEYRRYEAELMRFNQITNREELYSKNIVASTCFCMMYELLSTRSRIMMSPCEFAYLVFDEENSANNDDKAFLFIIKAACEGHVVTELKQKLHPSEEAIKEAINMMSSRWPLLCNHSFRSGPGDAYFEHKQLPKLSVSIYSLKHDFISRLRNKQFRYFISFAISVTNAIETLTEEMKGMLDYILEAKNKKALKKVILIESEDEEFSFIHVEDDVPRLIQDSKHSEVFVYHCFRDISIYVKLIEAFLSENSIKQELVAAKQALDNTYKEKPCCHMLLDSLRSEFEALIAL